MDVSKLKRTGSPFIHEESTVKRARSDEDVVVVEDEREINGKYVAGSRKSPVCIREIAYPFLF